MLPKLYSSKKEICELGRRLWLKGFCAGNEGNLSVRVGADRVLCTPSGVSKGFIRPAQICLVDLGGKQIDTANTARRTSEILMHLAIYKQRPDVQAVVHAHAPHATAFAIARAPLPEGIHPEAELFLGKVPLAPYVTPGGTPLGQAVCSVIAPDTTAVLMANHGAVCFGKSLLEAYYQLEILEAYCRLLLLAQQIGAIHQLSLADRIALAECRTAFGMAPRTPSAGDLPAWMRTSECPAGATMHLDDAQFKLLVDQVSQHMIQALGRATARPKARQSQKPRRK